jgi:hypothetical protein
MFTGEPMTPAGFVTVTMMVALWLDGVPAEFVVSADVR